jgi:hypothetical protein
MTAVDPSMPVKFVDFLVELGTQRGEINLLKKQLSDELERSGDNAPEFIKSLSEMTIKAMDSKLKVIDNNINQIKAKLVETAATLPQASVRVDA